MTNAETEKLKKLYEIYEQPMYRIAFSVLKNSSDAEDAVSDAFMSIIKKIGSIAERSNGNSVNRQPVDTVRTNAFMNGMVENRLQ